MAGISIKINVCSIAISTIQSSWYSVSQSASDYNVFLILIADGKGTVMTINFVCIVVVQQG